MSERARKAAHNLVASIPVKTITPWLIFMVIMYGIVRLFGGTGNESDTALLDVALSSAGQPPVVQAFVYISLGAMAKETLTDFSFASLRKVGQWKGGIYVLTDNPSCFTSSINTFNVIPVKVSPALAKNIMDIKALKTRLFEYLPVEIDTIVYMDVDIVVQRPVAHFLMDVSNSVKKMGNDFDIGAFPDAQGHYMGFCSGCEKWHTGVLLLKRYSGKECLKAWGKIISSGEFHTDQESMDAAEQRGACSNTLTMSPSYLLFAKDYIGMALTSGHTFVHLTAAGRLESQDYLYKNYIVPRLRGNGAVDITEKSKQNDCSLGRTR